MSGVAATSVSDRTPKLPKAASMMCRYARTGSPPTKARITALMSRATTTAPIVVTGDSQRGVAIRGSRRIVTERYSRRLPVQRPRPRRRS